MTSKNVMTVRVLCVDCDSFPIVKVFLTTSIQREYTAPRFFFLVAHRGAEGEND